jgi:hypothetical protein
MDQSDTFLERRSLKDYSCNILIQIVKLILRAEYFHNDFFENKNIYLFIHFCVWSKPGGPGFCCFFNVQ